MKTIDTLSSQERAALADLQRGVCAVLPGVPTQMTLFGSRARGDAEPDSDMDVLLELDLARIIHEYLLQQPIPSPARLFSFGLLDGPQVRLCRPHLREATLG